MMSELTITPPLNHHFVTTEDGSITIYSEKYLEAAHSTHGAIAETKLRFITGCDLENRLKQNLSHNIFEVGFGFGLGFLETYNLWSKDKKNNIHFISCEIDIELVKWCSLYLEKIFGKYYPKEAFTFLSKLILSPDQKFLSAKDANFNLTIYLGDIINHQNSLLHDWGKKIDSIFQDAYSPKKNPTLWTLEWFTFLKKLSNNDTILSTYSSSQSVRKNLIESGWSIKNGPAFGKKKSSTIAFANKVDHHE